MNIRASPGKTRYCLLGFLGLAVCGVCALLAFLAINFILPGLRQVGGDFEDIIRLQQELRQAYTAQDFQIGLANGSRLKVSLVNSPYSRLPAADQKIKAREIALFALDHFTGSRPFAAVDVSFIDQSGFWIFTTARTSTYSYSVQSLKP